MVSRAMVSGVNGPTITQILSGLKPTPAGYIKAARDIENSEISNLEPVGVAVLSTFTIDPVSPYIVVESARRGLLPRLYLAPFNQMEQEILDETSALYKFGADLFVLATRLEDIAASLVHEYGRLSNESIKEQVSQIQQRMMLLVGGLRESTGAPILVFNFAQPRFLCAGLADPIFEPSQASIVQQINDAVAADCRTFSGVHIFDHARTVAERGLRRWEDPRMDFLAKVPFGAEGQLETGRKLARYFAAALRPSKKCLVIDLDNTLWGGVLGEEGIGGIALSEDYPGNVYKDFQRALLALRDRGILLAVASKNNEPDVQEVFQNHPDCLLKATDFASMEIHWEDKASSLVAIANELNIGTDALAFFDDSPAEREWVRRQLPEVTVIDVPPSPLDYESALDESGVFDTLSISAEDKKRPVMYQKEQARRQMKDRSASLGQFLEDLDMHAVVGNVGVAALPRAAQLLAKTNQFNLTTKRHSSGDIQNLIDSGAVALWLRLTDRFGDNGLVGLAIAVPDELGQWSIDTFLMSCRVIGRRMETTLLSALSSEIASRGGKEILGEFRPTSKNGMVADFYHLHEFTSLPGDGALQGASLWKWDLSKGPIPVPKFVDLRFEFDGIDNG